MNKRGPGIRVAEVPTSADMERARGDLEVWRVDLDQSDVWVETAAAGVLEPGERKRFAEAMPEVRRRGVVARVALRIAIADRLGCDPGSIRFSAGAGGKPALAVPRGGLEFSVSHSGDVCLIALTTLGPVGIDVERVEPFPELERLIASRFAPREAAAIGALEGERQLRAFYDCWTRKEAYLKARGTGLANGIGGVVVSVEEDRPKIHSLEDDDPRAWTMFSVDLEPGLAGAVALRSGPALAVGGRFRVDHEVDAVELGIAQREVGAPVGPAGLATRERR